MTYNYNSTDESTFVCKSGITQLIKDRQFLHQALVMKVLDFANMHITSK